MPAAINCCLHAQQCLTCHRHSYILWHSRSKEDNAGSSQISGIIWSEELGCGQVLRFHCYWDDRLALYGDMRLFSLYYYLADDSIEVVEVLPRNCGRDPIPHMLRRMHLPKRPGPVGESCTLSSDMLIMHACNEVVVGAVSLASRMHQTAVMPNSPCGCKVVCSTACST